VSNIRHGYAKYTPSNPPAAPQNGDRDGHGRKYESEARCRNNGSAIPARGGMIAAKESA